jgi:hypothetical protein
MENGFQHSQPQSVYRGKKRVIQGLMIPVVLVGVWFYVRMAITEPSLFNFFTAGMVVFFMVQLVWVFSRTRLTMSPAGITVDFKRSITTTWANVERIQLVPMGIGIKADIPCLVLRQPIQARFWLRANDVPAELRSRIIPLYPALWERIDELEQELYRYLPTDPANQNQLSVPINFAANSRRSQKMTNRLLIPLALVLGVQLLVVLYIIWK